ncbi:peptidyl-prolyl cis-trans isomerase FKBP8-like isoform X2 [Artemia franciscana]
MAQDSVETDQATITETFDKNSSDLENKTDLKEDIQEESGPAKDCTDEASDIESVNKEMDEILSVPDPGIVESNVEKASGDQTVNEVETEGSMIEGAWADILGSGQLKKKTLRKGKSKQRPSSGDVCKIRYTGKLSDGLMIDTNDDFEFVLGDSEVIHAFDLIVALMELGEICQVETSPRFAYGEIGVPPKIPPNATIVYEIELIDSKPEKAPDELSLGERRKTGNKKRERGNWWYARSEYSKAIICYRRALDFLDSENEGVSEPPEKLQEILEDRLKVYNNMAAAQIKSEALDAAIKSLDVVLKCQPNNVKALYRKGKVLAEQGSTSDAIILFKKALSTEPEEKSIKSDLLRLETKQKNDLKKESSLYKKMLGNVPKKPVEKSGYEKVRLPVPWTLIAGSIFAFGASYLAYKYRFA